MLILTSILFHPTVFHRDLLRHASQGDQQLQSLALAVFRSCIHSDHLFVRAPHPDSQPRVCILAGRMPTKHPRAQRDSSWPANSNNVLLEMDMAPIQARSPPPALGPCDSAAADSDLDERPCQIDQVDHNCLDCCNFCFRSRLLYRSDFWTDSADPLSRGT
jgi:hypothetical protein